MIDFYKKWKPCIWVAIIGLPLLYCEVMWLFRGAAKAGCEASRVFDGSYESRVYCNRKADALSWGWKSDFEANGKVYTFDKDAEIYVLKGEVK